MFGKKKQPPGPTAKERAAEQAKTFFDSISPGVVKFMTDYYIVGDKWCCAWAIREYPVTTDEPAILSRLGDRTAARRPHRRNAPHLSPSGGYCGAERHHAAIDQKKHYDVDGK